MPNYRPAEEIRARVTVLADGTRGVLSEQLRERYGRGQNQQAYSLGIKTVMQFKGEHPFGAGRVAHFLGYPLPQNVFGGGFIYAMDHTTVAVGLIMALDWKYGDLNPQREFERFRAHPFVAAQLEGGVTIASGARTIPEGGYYAIGKVNVPGALVVGDGAGFVNMEKIKGIHNADVVGHGRGGDDRRGPGPGRRRRDRAQGLPGPPRGERCAARDAPRAQLPASLQVGPVRRCTAVAGLAPAADAAGHGARPRGHGRWCAPRA